jgi:hypothetical protein
LEEDVKDGEEDAKDGKEGISGELTAANGILKSRKMKNQENENPGEADQELQHETHFPHLCDL